MGHTNFLFFICPLLIPSRDPKTPEFLPDTSFFYEHPKMIYKVMCLVAILALAGGSSRSNLPTHPNANWTPKYSKGRPKGRQNEAACRPIGCGCKWTECANNISVRT